MGNFIKKGILHTLKFCLHTLSCHFWLNLCHGGNKNVTQFHATGTAWTEGWGWGCQWGIWAQPNQHFVWKCIETRLCETCRPLVYDQWRSRTTSDCEKYRWINKTYFVFNHVWNSKKLSKKNAFWSSKSWKGQVMEGIQPSVTKCWSGWEEAHNEFAWNKFDLSLINSLSAIPISTLSENA